MAWRQLDFLIPLTSQCTLAEPAAGVIQALERLEKELELSSLTWAGGFPLADIPDCGQALLAYGTRREQVNRAVELLEEHITRREKEFNKPILDDKDGVAHAIRFASGESGPIVIADTQDNPGGGGSSDTTGILAALHALRADGAVVASICDPAAAQSALKAGAGSTIRISLGGRTPVNNGAAGTPFFASFHVEKVSDGRFVGTGPMWLGSPIDLGASALLRCEGIRVIVTSEKMQAADKSLFHHFGIDPSRCKIIALKSSVHFRADFQDIAREILVVASPGLVYSRLQDIPYKNLRPSIMFT